MALLLLMKALTRLCQKTDVLFLQLFPLMPMLLLLRLVLLVLPSVVHLCRYMHVPLASGLCLGKVGPTVQH